MIHDLSDVRYRGDLQDVEDLMTTYRVGDYVAGSEAPSLPALRAGAFAPLDT